MGNERDDDRPIPRPVSGVPADGAAADPLRTNPSVFRRMGSAEDGLREIAWREFFDRYVPVIRGFARALRARPHDVEDVVQDVMVGFFGARARFAYDPAKGRFRGYLKVATLNAIRARAARAKAGPARTVPLTAGGGDEGPADTAEAARVEAAWEAEWEKQLMTRALGLVRQAYRDGKTFQAFELVALRGTPAERVAEQLGISIDSVYQAKKRITRALREQIKLFEVDEP